MRRHHRWAQIWDGTSRCRLCVCARAVLLQVTNCMLNAGTASAVLGESGRQLYEFEAVRVALGLLRSFVCARVAGNVQVLGWCGREHVGANVWVWVWLMTRSEWSELVT